MRYLTYSATQSSAYPICVLVPEIRKDDIRAAYLDPHGVNAEEVLVIDLHQTRNKKKTPVAEIKAYIEQELVDTLTGCQVEYILCGDADYFKVLTKSPKADANIGYVLDCVYGPWKVIYVPNYRQIFYDPDKVREKIASGMQALHSHRARCYTAPGSHIIQSAAYPVTFNEIVPWLQKLLDTHTELDCDIETFSLKHPTAGIGTIAFSWSEHEGIAFPVDLGPEPEKVRHALHDFFVEAHRRGITFNYHKINFDVCVLIYQLFMDHILDQEGLLYGLEILLTHWNCTRIIAYLATNSCAGNELGLKQIAQEFAGNWAVEEIKDITKIPLPKLLEYNLVDALSCRYAKKKHWRQMVVDDQLKIYRELFQPAMIDIIQMQLTGMPVDMNQVKKVKVELEADRDSALDRIQSSVLVQAYNYDLRLQHCEKRNAKLKTKKITLADAECDAVFFNPNSGPQLQGLLYNALGLPVISYTDSRQPSTDADTLKALRNHTQDQKVIGLLDALLDLAAVSIILNTFIPALEGAFEGPDGWHYMFGNFNLGGTLSGRLSSSEPNLQNIPAKGRYGKKIKSCFVAPPGWLFAGLDFDSLEDKISALTTKDPNKLKVYTDGYDGHCLRAYSYFTDQMPDIDGSTVAGINAIKKKYDVLRDESKVPTFALTYQGTFKTLMTKCGFDEAKAKKIETAYHELYKVSDDWVASRLDQATQTGFITAAFGLKVRTPLLKQVIRGTSKTPAAAEAEGRSAGNALGQSWCLLNTRAGVEFNHKVRKSAYKLDIKPCSHIHDAQYFLIRDDIRAVQFTNEHLVMAVQWQQHPDIAHNEVKLGGKLGIFYPSWEKEITIPNNATDEQIFEVIEAAMT